MADNESSGASGSSKKKRARYNNSFRSEWSSQFECIRASRLGESHAFCQVCASDFKVTHGGINDVRKHLNTEKHVKCAKCLESTSKAVFDKFKVSTGNHTDNVTKAELLMQGFVIEHNLPIAVCDHFTKLVKNMFPDSRIAKDFSASRTKSTHLIYEIAETSCESICKQLEKKWYSLATDGSSDEEDKFFPVLLTHWNQGEVVTSFLDMPVANNADARNIFQAVSDSLSAKNIGFDSCVAFASDNASVMIAKDKGVLTLLKKENPSVYGMGCPCHLSHLAAKRGAKELHFSPEVFVLDLYYHFDRSTKRKQQLRDEMGFNDQETMKVLKHVPTRWLSLSRCMERALKLWDGLRSYFLSTFYDDDPGAASGSRKKQR
ncbi:hypothetical protein HOLleu_28235 [Holothuria leucospilota]|uniref:Uncharacterized protein n=1 Tax=Holothuria leucospilota TaxID=206669 RepID=A0A9Q1BLP0_HOLLE|nr:hypothetical protein HOLleu_28235 [Holothuria leucospilota]